jgi:hypothetical protein
VLVPSDVAGAPDQVFVRTIRNVADGTELLADYGRCTDKIITGDARFMVTFSDGWLKKAALAKNKRARDSSINTRKDDEEDEDEAQNEEERAGKYARTSRMHSSAVAVGSK